MDAFTDAMARYRDALETTPWVSIELYKIEWAHELSARVDWRDDDETICDTIESLQTRRYGEQRERGVNFVAAHVRYGTPLMTPDVVAQMRRCVDREFADLDWKLDGLPYPVLSCYVATLFPGRLRPLHNTGFDPLFEYLFAEDYEPFGANGVRHVRGAQPYLERIAIELERSGVVRCFAERIDQHYGSDSEEEPPFDVDPAGRLLSNWVAQDFCYYLLLWMDPVGSGLAPDSIDALHPDEAEEGERRLYVHRRRERDSRLARQAKDRALAADPVLPCEACGSSFLHRYGPEGEGVIEAHHVEPLGERAGSRRTRVEDFAMLCSDCHTMVHRSVPAKDVEELRAMIARAGRRKAA